jgi:radical SAM protein with 4Fe4S-binding SPASM domain
LIVSWNTTNECNLFCEHCYREAGKESEHELTTEEGFALLDEIAKAGFKLMVFSGGEPFMRKDILDLTKHAASLGLRPVYGSNGTLLTLDMAKRIKEAGGSTVAISFHMMDKDEMDTFCRSPDTYDKSIQAMKNCAEADLAFQVNTTVFDRNMEDVEQICDLAKEMGAKSHHVLFLVPTGRGANIEEETLREVQYERLIRKLLKKREAMDFDVKPTCAPQFMRIADQLEIDTGFSEIWTNSPVFQKMRSMEYTGQCGGCDYAETCGGCRARAYFYFDDYMAHEPWCSYKRGSSRHDK